MGKKIIALLSKSTFLDLAAMGSCRGRWHQHIQKGIRRSLTTGPQ